ncbi:MULTISPECIES: glycosyltransferase [Sphingobacterium]|uniref:Glycosyltransferase n=1 Tax=Sphingobacterium populi TaxID=1812824 RepID=A0ABW5UBZ1_9SPHI|nr:glycosyltransferase [Sphingobacterium sp. CFCC 11742]
MQRTKLFVIGQVWPEPTSSAAGWRMLQLLGLFLKQYDEVHFASAAARSPHSHRLDEMNIICHSILLNDSSFDKLIKELQPDVVLFDRFMVEEQFGWRVAEHCPQAIRILDTEDLHFLRLARQEAYRQQQAWSEELLYSPTAMRELATIYRCDLSLIISRSEYDLLVDQFRVSESLLYYLPFFAETFNDPNSTLMPTFSDRKNLIFIGNFLHEPNWKTVELLKKTYWPEIRKALPEAELHIYGAYASQKVEQLHNTKDGFLIKGRADDARQTMQSYRLLLAPIPFGAGQKGKFVDAMITGTPSITSSVGAEGMNPEYWPGVVADLLENFVSETVKLYTNEAYWLEKQALISSVLSNLMADDLAQMLFVQHIAALTENLAAHRNQNMIGRILAQEQYAAKKYMSRWIEAKNISSK